MIDRGRIIIGVEELYCDIIIFVMLMTKKLEDI